MPKMMAINDGWNGKKMFMNPIYYTINDGC